MTGSADVALRNVGTAKYVLTTRLTVEGESHAMLFKSRDQKPYIADGVTKNGTTTFTFNAPAGLYPELVIMVDKCEEYCLYDFTLGKDSLPETVQIVKPQQSTVKIISQPYDVSINSGADATFAVKATGSSLKYQWQVRKNGATGWTDWKGRTERAFTVTSKADWNNMLVRCRITDASGKSVYSSTARVTFVSTPVITRQPEAAIKASPGADVTFSVKAKGKSLQYVWYYTKSDGKGWRIWKGRSSDTFTVTANDTWNNMLVRCVITDAAGQFVTSAASKVTLIQTTLKITAQPSPVRVKSGEPAVFSLKAVGNGMTFQWYYKKAGATAWTEWKGRTQSSFTVNANDTWNGMKVYCRVTDANGKSVKSDEITVTLL